MPLPKTSDVGKIMGQLKEEGGRPRKQMVAIALSQARKHGAKIPVKSKADKKRLVMKARAGR